MRNILDNIIMLKFILSSFGGGARKGGGGLTPEIRL